MIDELLQLLIEEVDNNSLDQLVDEVDDVAEHPVQRSQARLEFDVNVPDLSVEFIQRKMILNLG